MDRSIMARYRRTALNGKSRPFLVSRDVVAQRPLPAKAATQFQATDWY